MIYDYFLYHIIRRQALLYRCMFFTQSFCQSEHNGFFLHLQRMFIELYGLYMLNSLDKPDKFVVIKGVAH